MDDKMQNLLYVNGTNLQHGCIKRAGYCVFSLASQFFQFPLVLLQRKKIPVAQKIYSPSTSIIKDRHVKLLTGHVSQGQVLMSVKGYFSDLDVCCPNVM